MLVTVGCLGIALAAGELIAQQPAARRAFYELREHQVEYSGPGREQPAPADVEEVLIGYFGPSDPDHPLGGGMWRAAKMAVRLANEQGGYQGRPFRLVPGWSDSPWGSGVVHVTRMAYRDKVWAIVGGIDGPSTHLAEQVVAKARLPLVSPVSSDKTVNLANVPWTFSLVPGDHLQARLLANQIVVCLEGGPLVLVSADDHDSRLLTVELKAALARHHVFPRHQFEYRSSAETTAKLTAAVAASKPAAVAVIAGTDDGARLVAALRDQGFRAAIFGGPSMGRGRFIEMAGPAADGVVFPMLLDSAFVAVGPPNKCLSENVFPSPRLRGEGPGVRGFRVGSRSQARVLSLRRQFIDTFEDLYAAKPDYAAAHTYDAVRLLIEAVNEAGLNRARIRDALRDLSPWTGVTGPVQWDRTGSNTRDVRLGTIKNGRYHSVPAASPP